MRAARVAAGIACISWLQHRRAQSSARECPRNSLSAGDLVTCARGSIAAFLIANSLMSRQRGALGPLQWSVVVAALSVMDWIDGPLSRRSSSGPRPYGSWLDAEADAWLTFAVALAASQRKVAPSVLLAAPFLTLMRPPERVSHAPGARFTGALQLSVLVFSLGPPGTVCRTFARWPYYAVALCSIGSYVLQIGLLAGRRGR